MRYIELKDFQDNIKRSIFTISISNNKSRKYYTYIYDLVSYFLDYPLHLHRQ